MLRSGWVGCRLTFEGVGDMPLGSRARKGVVLTMIWRRRERALVLLRLWNYDVVCRDLRRLS